MLNTEKAYNFIATHQAFTSGAWSLTQQTDLQKKVTNELKLNIQHPEFTEFYEHVMLTYLKGATQA